MCEIAKANNSHAAVITNNPTTDFDHDVEGLADTTSANNNMIHLQLKNIKNIQFYTNPSGNFCAAIYAHLFTK